MENIILLLLYCGIVAIWLFVAKNVCKHRTKPGNKLISIGQWILLLLPVMIITYAFLSPLMVMKITSPPSSLECISRLQCLGMAFQMYAVDYGTYPPVGWNKSAHRPRWVQTMRSEYIKPGSLRILKCPFDKSNNISSYDYNSQVAGKPYKKLGADIALLSERGYPHPSGKNVCYCDGHVDWVKKPHHPHK